MIAANLKKLSVDLSKGLEPKLIEVLKDFGIEHYFYHSARTSRLRFHSRWYAPWKQPWSLYDEVASSFWFYTNSERASAIEQKILSELGLEKSGRGTLKSSFVDVLSAFSLDRNNQMLSVNQKASSKDALLVGFSELIGIVPRGKADVLNRIILGLGVCAPLSYYGMGNGKRDQLGLLRITIPAEKEMVKFIVPTHDAQAITKTIVEECGFDRANQGIIYQLPLNKCVPDSLIRIGQHEHAASMEQVINAMDSLKGSTLWRTRDYRRQSKRIKTETQICLSFICDEGSSGALSQVAMQNGAPGASTFRCGYQNLSADPSIGGEITKEFTSMVVPESRQESIVSALTKSEYLLAGVIVEIAKVNSLELLRKNRIE